MARAAAATAAAVGALGHLEAWLSVELFEEGHGGDMLQQPVGSTSLIARVHVGV